MTGINGSAPKWPEERTEKMLSLWAEGLSASQIGREMGISRNAVIGKLHRLRGSAGINRTGAKPLVREPRIIKVKKPNYSVAKAKRKHVEPPKVVPLTEIVPLNGIGVTLLSRKRNQCHAVVEVPGLTKWGAARYCGHPVAGKEPYCADHCTAFYRELPPRVHQHKAPVPRLG